MVPMPASSCPRCAAPLRRAADLTHNRRRASAGDSLGAVLTLFGVQLLTSIIFGVMVSFGLGAEARAARDPRGPLNAMVGLEAIDTAVIAFALVRLPRPRAFAPLLKPAIAWVLAFPVILLALFLNHAYHTAMASLLHARSEPDLILAGVGFTPLVFFAYCVQPAIVEEIFFRYLALDTLRTVMSPWAAIFLSSMMFGLAHIGVPLSIPILGVVGIALAWARVASGSLILPMVLHAFHNLCVVLWS
jgi:membrane protease YdiL (CAAX protease family)